MGSRKQTSGDLEWIDSLAKAKDSEIKEIRPAGEGWKTFKELLKLSPSGHVQLRETLRHGCANGTFEGSEGKLKNCLGNLYKVMFYRMKDAE